MLERGSSTRSSLKRSIKNEVACEGAFQRGTFRSSLPHPSKIGARKYGHEQMRTRRDGLQHMHELVQREEKRVENEYLETSSSLFNCISDGILNMDQAAKIMWNLKQRGILNMKAYDEFVQSEEAMAAIPDFDELDISDDDRNRWYNIMAVRMQCEINHALIRKNESKQTFGGYYMLQEVQLAKENTNEVQSLQKLRRMGLITHFISMCIGAYGGAFLAQNYEIGRVPSLSELAKELEGYLQNVSKDMKKDK